MKLLKRLVTAAMLVAVALTTALPLGAAMAEDLRDVGHKPGDRGH